MIYALLAIITLLYGLVSTYLSHGAETVGDYLAYALYVFSALSIGFISRERRGSN